MNDQQPLATQRFIPVRRFDGFRPIEDHGLIGDGTTAALVGRDGAITWLCVPRFDSPALFCGLLDASHGGAFTIELENLEASRQSATLCQVALDRGARLVTRLGLPGDDARWRAQAERIREVILEEAWDERLRSLTEHLGGGGLDASLLTLPLRRVVAADHPFLGNFPQAFSHVGLVSSASPRF